MHDYQQLKRDAEFISRNPVGPAHIPPMRRLAAFGVEMLPFAEAHAKLEEIARGLARYRGMVSGYLTVNIGAGNPDYFYEIVYQQNGYDESGLAKSGGAIVAHGRTLPDALNMLLAAMKGGG